MTVRGVSLMSSIVSWWKGRSCVRERGQSWRFGYSSKHFGGEGKEGVGLSLSSQLGPGMKESMIVDRRGKDGQKQKPGWRTRCHLCKCSSGIHEAEKKEIKDTRRRAGVS